MILVEDTLQDVMRRHPDNSVANWSRFPGDEETARIEHIPDRHGLGLRHARGMPP